MDLDVCKQFLFVIGIKEFIREISGGDESRKSIPCD